MKPSSSTSGPPRFKSDRWASKTGRPPARGAIFAIVYHGIKRYGDAQAAYDRAIHGFEISAGADSLDLLDCLKRDAEVLRKLERFAEAEQAEVRATRIEVRNAIRAEKQS